MARVDPDGMDLVISGILSNKAIKQLQYRMQNRITLSIDEESGRISYSLNEGQKLKGDAKRMARMIDDHSIIVNLITTDKNETSTGNLMIGGAFMGNNVTTDVNGSVSVVANQEVNPNVLEKISNAYSKPGAEMLHEATEAYQGALISQNKGVSSPAAHQNGSVYQQAHEKATKQSGPIYRRIYDAFGNEMQMSPGGGYPNGIYRADWYVNDRNGNKIIIQDL